MGGFYHNKKNRSEFATKFKQFSLNYQFKNFVKEKHFFIKKKVFIVSTSWFLSTRSILEKKR